MFILKIRDNVDMTTNQNIQKKKNRNTFIGHKIGFYFKFNFLHRKYMFMAKSIQM